nr:MAG TPA_asm: hypothetical protein [Caudoviricetes sp.]
MPETSNVKRLSFLYRVPNKGCSKESEKQQGIQKDIWHLRLL